MKRILFPVVVALVFIAFSCNGGETMQEKLRKEKKATEAFIDRNDFVILKNYPKDGVFKENEYYRTSDGLYINVVDSGNGRRVTPYVDEVQVRFDYLLDIIKYVKDESTDKMQGEYFTLPKEFIYGNSASYSRPDPDGVSLACDGWAYPLLYVGEGAIVNLIIPSSLAGSEFSNSFVPVYYKNLRYTTFY